MINGCPVWEVSEPYISTWLYDRPLGRYQPGLGYPVNFKLAYKQRDTRTLSPNFFGFGKLWDSSWLTYISDEPIYRISMTMTVPGGGERTYTPDGATREYFSHTTMQRTTDGSDNLTGFIISYASGAIDYYQYVPTNLLDAVQVAFLSEKVDPAGQTNRFIYQETNDIVFLKFVIDADGHTNMLFYTNATFPSYVTGVQDPFGRMATINYDENSGSVNYGMVTSIVDVAMLPSSFSYDSQGWVTNLHTPYGPTVFQYATNTDNYGTEFDDNQPYTFIRAVRVIDPAAGTNIYMLRQDSSIVYTNIYDPYTNSGNYFTFLPSSYDASVVPSGIPTPTLDNTYLYYRDSFRWNPRQATGLPLDVTTFAPSDFKKARMRHWLHDRVHYNLGQTLDMQQEPSPDGTHDGQTIWFDYDGKSDPVKEGSCSLPSLIARVLPDGTTWYRWFRRDEWARATNIVETYSTGFGDSPLTRTNVYLYNGDDLVKLIGPRGETLAGYYYDGNHQLLRATNAVGDVWYYSYDSKGRLTYALSPAGLNTDYIYFGSGDFANWVATNIDREISRTNSFTYTDNLIYTHTDERGLTTTNNYDPLSRPTSVGDSRGVITYTYDKLELIQVVDRMGFTNRYVYDLVRRLTAQTNALGRFTLYNYCTCGALDSIRDAEGNYTYYFYDNAGRL
jgi:YD repeat-containing protein